MSPIIPALQEEPGVARWKREERACTTKGHRGPQREIKAPVMIPVKTTAAGIEPPKCSLRPQEPGMDVAERVMSRVAPPEFTDDRVSGQPLVGLAEGIRHQQFRAKDGSIF